MAHQSRIGELKVDNKVIEKPFHYLNPRFQLENKARIIIESYNYQRMLEIN